MWEFQHPRRHNSYLQHMIQNYCNSLSGKFCSIKQLFNIWMVTHNTVHVATLSYTFEVNVKHPFKPFCSRKTVYNNLITGKWTLPIFWFYLKTFLRVTFEHIVCECEGTHLQHLMSVIQILCRVLHGLLLVTGMLDCGFHSALMCAGRHLSIWMHCCVV